MPGLQHCSFIAQTMPFSSNHHLSKLRNHILQEIGCPSCGNHQEQKFWKFSRHASLHGSCRANAADISLCTATGSGPRNAQSQQNLSFCGYDNICAAPSFVIVQCRAPCLCNADPCSCASPTLMPPQCRSRCHGLHTFGQPHLFLSLRCTNTIVCKAMQNTDSRIYPC